MGAPKNRFQDKRDAVEAYLQDEYDLPEDSAKAYASDLRAKNDRSIIPAAMEKMGNREIERIEKINYYLDLKSKVNAGEELDDDDQTYYDNVEKAQKAHHAGKAKEALEAQKMQQMVSSVSNFRPGAVMRNDGSLSIPVGKPQPQPQAPKGNTVRMTAQPSAPVQTPVQAFQQGFDKNRFVDAWDLQRMDDDERNATGYPRSNGKEIARYAFDLSNMDRPSK